MKKHGSKYLAGMAAEAGSREFTCSNASGSQGEQMKQCEAFHLKAHPRWNSYFSKAIQSRPLLTLATTGDQVFKRVRPWGTSSIQAITKWKYMVTKIVSILSTINQNLNFKKNKVFYFFLKKSWKWKTSPMEISEGLHISMSIHTVRKEAIKLIVSQVLALLLAFLV